VDQELLDRIAELYPGMDKNTRETVARRIEDPPEAFADRIRKKYGQDVFETLPNALIEETVEGHAKQSESRVFDKEAWLERWKKEPKG
jgi:hypothetical protein